MPTQTNLSHMIYAARFNDGTSHLSINQQAAILAMVGKGCRQPTKDKLARRLAMPLSLWKDYGIYSRLIQEDNDPCLGFEYICGQSWPDEMRTLRECMTTI